MKHMNIREILEQFGLEKNEANLYLAALPLGTAPASRIALKAKIPRSTARFILDKLVERGLVMKGTQANTQLYTAENPTKILSIIAQQEEQLNRRKSQIQKSMPELQQLYNPDTKVPAITYYSGIDGIKRLLEHNLKHPSNIVSFGWGDYFNIKIPTIVDTFRRLAQKYFIGKKISVLRPPKYRESYTNNDQMKNGYYSQIEEFPIDIQITDDYLSIISIDDGNPVWILIQHQTIAKSFKMIFEEIWGSKW
jgi:sugar-specific transcriptional regulator TrmB